MAKSGSRRSSRPQATVGPGDPVYAGRHLVLLPEDDVKSGVSALKSIAGLRIAHSRDLGGRSAVAALQEADGIVFDTLQVAVIAMPPDRLQRLNSLGSDKGIMVVEPERRVHAFANGRVGLPLPVPALPSQPSAGPWSPDYLRGYRDGSNAVLDRLIGDAGSRGPGTVTEPYVEVEATWGLQAIGATRTRWTGDGIGVAVLDTGFDLRHPDFKDRIIEARNFVPGAEVQDGNGHGTHCIGTACGSSVPSRLPRYGVAGNAQIFAGKVLSDEGSGSDASILAGIDWAVAQGCAVISMSLGAAVEPGAIPSMIFEQVGRRALRAGTLIVAAAGNDSRRPDLLSPVSHPANCPSIMAVAAVDRELAVAWFSCAGLNPQGGQIDIAAPGVAVLSAWPGKLYETINGTSMATPHVAGVAALIAESDLAARGHALWTRLIQGAHRLDQPARDVGAGLVQAPT